MSDGNHRVNRATSLIYSINSEPSGTFREDFADWIKENSHIYDAFEKRAFRLIRSGAKRGSAVEIIEVIRWQSRLAENRYPDADVVYKINNNFRPDLARLFEARFPSYQGFFELRRRSETHLRSPRNDRLERELNTLLGPNL